MKNNDHFDKDSESIKKILSNQENSFQYGFSDQVVRTIELEEQTVNFNYFQTLYSSFKWLAYGSLAGVVIFVFLLFQEGAFQDEGLYGVKSMGTSDAITLNFYDNEIYDYEK